MSTATAGVLITSDEESIVFLVLLNEKAEQKFILAQLDKLSLFVRSSAVRAINASLQRRLAETVFTAEGDDEA